MYYNLIKSYVDRLTIEDLDKFANSKGITLTEEEQPIIYNCIKQHWETFYYGNPKEILEDLKQKINIDTYNKIEALYVQAKNMIN